MQFGAETADALPRRRLSAEATIALSLLGVCAAVGIGALVVLGSDDKHGGDHPAQARAGNELRVDAAEKSALQNLQQGLQRQFSAQDRIRERAAELAAEEAREQARAHAEAQGHADAAAQAAARQRAAQTRAATAPATDLAATAPAQTVAPIPATVDWSSCRRPDYPRRSLQRSEQGTATMSFEVSVDGRASGGRIVTTSGSELLDRAALRAVGRCRFTPATLSGRALASTVIVRFEWRLTNG